MMRLSMINMLGMMTIIYSECGKARQPPLDILCGEKSADVLIGSRAGLDAMPDVTRNPWTRSRARAWPQQARGQRPKGGSA